MLWDVEGVNEGDAGDCDGIMDALSEVTWLIVDGLLIVVLDAASSSAVLEPRSKASGENRSV